MTRTEAINYLRPIAESASLRRYKEALGLALDALNSQEDPATTCSDCEYHGHDPETDKHFCWRPLGCMGCVPVKPEDFCSRWKRKDGLREKAIEARKRRVGDDLAERMEDDGR